MPLTVTSDSAGSILCLSAGTWRMGNWLLERNGFRYVLEEINRVLNPANTSSRPKSWGGFFCFVYFFFSTLTSSSFALRNLGSSGILRLALFTFPLTSAVGWSVFRVFYFFFLLSPLGPAWFAASFPLFIVIEFKRKFGTWKIVPWNHYSSHQSKHSQSWHALEVVARNANG